MSDDYGRIITEERYEGAIPDANLSLPWIGAIKATHQWHVWPHIHFCCELSLITQGNVIIAVGEHEYELKAGYVSISKPGELHEIKGTGSSDWSKLYVGVDKFDPEELTQVFSQTKVRYITDCEDTAWMLERALEEIRNSRFGSNKMAQSFMIAWLIEIARRIGTSPDAKTPPTLSPVVFAARSYIEINARHRLSVGEVARHVGLSESRLSHVFTKETHTSIYKYILLSVMYRAERLINDHRMNVTEVSRLLKFPSVSNFSAAYKRFFGYSPTHSAKP